MTTEQGTDPETRTPDPGTPSGTRPDPGTPPGTRPDPGTPSGTRPDPGTPPGARPGSALQVADGPRATPAPGRRKRPRKPLPSTRPQGAPEDPWTAFATTAERGPGRFRRGARRVRRAAVHEYALVTYAAMIIAVVLTWPTLKYPLHTLPQDVYDPAHQAWQVSWLGHILRTDPVRLWQSNAFFPEPYSLAWGSSLLGYAPAGLLGDGPLAAVLRYNVLFVLAHALLVIGGYALVRQLGAGRTGAAVTGIAFAYAPWRLAQGGHLDIISAGGIPLALAMIARGHGWSMRFGHRPGKRHAGWAAAGWLVATWQISLGFSLGLPFAGVLAGVLLVIAIAVPIRRRRAGADRDGGNGDGQPGDAINRAAAAGAKVAPVLGWRILVTDLLGALIFAGVGALIALPYFRHSVGGSGSTAEIEFFSPPLRSLLIGPAESRIWGAPHEIPRSSLRWPAEMSLLPGFVLYAFALAGLFFSIWKLWQRLILVLALAAAVILTLGTTFFDGRWTYLPIFGHLPGGLGLRIPGRLMLWVTLLLAVLAGGAVAEVVRRAEQFAAQRIPPWPGPWLRLATLVPLLLVLGEAWNATPHPVVPARPAAMRTVTSPMLVLPTTALTDQTVLLWTTSRFPPVMNGGGGFAGARQTEMRQRVSTFPDAGSIEYLRGRGVATVLLIRSQVAGTRWERSGDIPVDALGIRREDLDDAVVFYLS